MNRLEVRNLGKSFLDTPVLRDVSLTVAAGEMHGIVGANGSGKSTLARILSGEIAADAGETRLDGERFNPADIHASIAAGVSGVGQDVQLFPGLRIYENILIGRERLTGTRSGLIVPGRKRQIAEAAALLEKVGLDVDPLLRLDSLSPIKRRLVRFASALAGEPKLLVLDELTSGLNAMESGRIFETLGECAARGAGILLLTHNIQETVARCSRVSVLRGGTVVAGGSLGEQGLMDRMLGGQAVAKHFPRTPARPGKTLLEVRDLTTDVLSGVAFSLRAGEVLGIAGLLGSGRTNLVKAIAGVEPVKAGEIVIHDSPDSRRFQSRVGVLPKRQSVNGLFPRLSVGKNITISNLARLRRRGVISPSRETISARDIMDRLGVKGDSEQPVRELSFGNRQKTLIARCVYSRARLLLFDDPCSGIDAAGRVAVYNMINELARKGCAILLVSSDFTELIGMSDRILALRNGRLMAHLPSGEATEELLYTYTSN